MGVVNRNGGLQPEHVGSKREGRGEAYREREREALQAQESQGTALYTLTFVEVPLCSVI